MSEANVQRAFWFALQQGDAARMRELVATGADVNLPIGLAGDETPLIRAITSGDEGLVKLLIELGADVNRASPGSRGWTPLMFAHDKPVLIRELVAAGAEVNARTVASCALGPGGKRCPGGETALHLAAACGQGEAVRALIEAGAAVEARAEDGRAPLDYAAQWGAVNEAALALVAAGAALTPERVEALHAAAHNPDSDLVAFPLPQKGDQHGSEGGAAAGGGGHEAGWGAQQRGEGLRCPKCQGLIYSRKSKLCGHCGARLPPELVLSDEAAAVLQEERRWARELAEQFGRAASGQGPAARPAGPGSRKEQEVAEAFSAEELLRRVSCAEEFKHRERPVFWLYVVGYSLMLFVLGWLSLNYRLLPPKVLLLLTGFFGWQCWQAWLTASPICPNCKQNIRSCAAAFCHGCGRSLRQGWCADCRVNYSWTRWFVSAYSHDNNLGWIRYCPGCGVELDSKVRRWEAGE